MGLTRIRAEQISDIDYKQAVRVITLTDITIAGGAPAEVDGVSLVAGDRVLVNGQSDAAQNGLYRVQTVGAGSNGTWVRTTDGNEDGEIQPGMVVMVTQGTQYADTPWKLTTNGEIIIGTTELNFAENYSLAFGNIVANGTAILANTVSAPVSFAAGDNISITGNNTTKTVTFAVTGITTSRIANGTSNVDIATANGNVTTTVNGNTTLTVTDLGANIAGYVTVTDNITGGNLLPPTDNTGVVGTADLTWNNGRFTDLTIDDVLTVRTAIDLADGDRLRLGTNDDWQIYHDGTSNRMDLFTRDLTIRDDNTTRFTFGRTTGDFTATGNVTGGNILGNGASLSGINAFGNIAVAGESTVSADNTSDTLTFAEGSGISITTDAANNIITIGSVATDSIFATGGDMGTVTEAVTVSEDLGLITDAATVEYRPCYSHINRTRNKTCQHKYNIAEAQEHRMMLLPGPWPRSRWIPPMALCVCMTVSWPVVQTLPQWLM
jgi:hypothetical protein